MRVPNGGFRLFYTAVGPAKPFPACQGYILSAVSDDGLIFRTEPGIRLAPRPTLPHMSLIQIGQNEYRMYYAACDQDGNWRIASAVSA